MKLTFTVLLLALSITAFSQNFENSKAYMILQGTANKFKKADIFGGGNMSFGVRIKEIVGVGINAQLIRFKGDKTNLIPISGEISLTTNKGVIRPFLNFQVGKAFYNLRTSISVDRILITSDVDGGLYLSPGAGVFVPVKHSSGLLISASYVSTSFKSLTTTEDRNTPGPSSKIYNSGHETSGFRIGVGFMLQ